MLYENYGTLKALKEIGSGPKQTRSESPIKQNTTS